MGWWKVSTLEGNKILMSDSAADTLGKALSDIVKMYQAELQRKPTRAELNDML